MKRLQSRVSALVVIAMLGSLLVMPAPASAAAGSFAGGPDQYSVTYANDHSAFAVHFAADASGGLEPNTTYYVKVRFTVGTSPSGSTNRGFTWNPASGLWAQERDDWIGFPQVTTDASGAISGSSGWVFAKFGDDTKAGDYHLMVSLSASGSSSTFNGSFVPTVTVLDPRTSAGWVHNGVATGKASSKNARLTDETSTTVLAVQKTEGQGVDDDANTHIDDEDYGPIGAAGDFRMPASAGVTVKVNLNQAVWPSGSSTFAVGPADTDSALGAADSVAPGAPGTLAVASGDGTASLSWMAATDNVGVTGYRIYRWSPAPVGAAYSPVHALLATVGSGTTSYADSGLANGQTYLYEIRAIDAATNSGPRSNAATATPAFAAPLAVVAPAAPDGENGWYVSTATVTLTPGTIGRTTQYAFEPTPAVWTNYTEPIAIPEGVSTLYYRDTDGIHNSAVQSLDFKVDRIAPTMFVESPLYSTDATTSKSFPVIWEGLDSGSGIASYDVFYQSASSGGSFGATSTLRLATEQTSTTFAGTSGATYSFWGVARDAAGNTSTSSDRSGTSVPYDQTKASYSSGWKTVAKSSDFLGSYKYSTSSRAYANYTLSRGTLYLVANTGPKMGKVAVYWRGKKVATINTYSSTNKVRQVFKVVKFSGSSSSTVKLKNLATSGHPRVEIDGFVVR